MRPNNHVDELAERVTNVYIRTLWFIMPAVWIAYQALAARHYLDCDGITYTDIAYQCVKGNWNALVNPRWGTGYPALLSMFLSVIRPTPYHEIMVIRIFNCFVLVCALFCFRFLMNSVANQSKTIPISENGSRALPLWALRAIGYTLFFWTTVELFPPYVNAPDIFVLAALLLAAAISLKIISGKDNWLYYGLFGVVLGIGYLIKAPVLTISPVFFLTTFLGTYRRPRALSGLLFSIILFGVMSAPLIYGLSKSKGRITFGGSGAIAYAEAVNWIETTVYWQGEPPAAGTPTHPLRKLLDAPTVYEYAHHDSSTYTLWYDQSYWYDGVRPYFQLKRQLNVIHIGLTLYFRLLTEQLGGFLAGYLILLFLGGSFRSYTTRLVNAFPLWGPAAAGFGMYALVHVEPRFLNAFLILAAIACISSIRFSRPEASPIAIRSVVLAIVTVLAAQILYTAGHSASQFMGSSEYPDWRVSEQLHSIGVVAGDKVSFIGDTLLYHEWAHLARVSIVSEVPPSGVSTFWAGTPEVRSHVLRLFANSGAKAAVTMNLPRPLLSDGWQRVEGTDYFILSLEHH